MFRAQYNLLSLSKLKDVVPYVICHKLDTQTPQTLGLFWIVTNESWDFLGKTCVLQKHCPVTHATAFYYANVEGEESCLFYRNSARDCVKKLISVW